jgi:hypothetical protein
MIGVVREELDRDKLAQAGLAGTRRPGMAPIANGSGGLAPLTEEEAP